MRFGFREPYARYDDDTLFNGTQLDDFLACAGKKPKSILVLGSGPGAVCFTLARALPDAERIDGVDIDSREIALARSVREYLGIPVVEFFESDAAAHLGHARGRLYDVILIDLFEGMNYSPLNFSHHFWEMVDGALSEDGLVLVNMWAYPAHLRPLDGVTPVADLLSVVGAATSFTSCLPLSHLRNTTVVIGREESSLLSLATSPACSSDGEVLDAVSSSALKAKIEYADIVEVAGPKNPVREWTLDRIQSGFNERLSSLAGEVTPVPERQSLQHILDDRDLTAEIARVHSGFRRLVASTYHSDHVAARKDRLSWLPEWLSDNWEWATNEDPAWAYGSAAWHIASTAASLRCLTDAERQFAVTAFPHLAIAR